MSCDVTATVKRTATERSTLLIFAKSVMLLVTVKTAMATWLLNYDALNKHLAAMPSLLLVTTAMTVC